MRINNHNPKNYFSGQSFEKTISRMNRINPEDANAHGKWKQQIISDILILIVFFALVIYLFLK